MTKVLREGMGAKDLEDLVLPLVSVDEFESKIDDDAIVFGFYVADHDAANDLNRFIQKSPVAILDTEVSPAPDEHGYYFVFFEIMKDDDVSENVTMVLDEVSELANITNWQLRIRGLKDLVPFSKKALRRLPGDEKGDEKGDEGALHEAILQFLKPSGLTDAVLEGDHLRLEGMGHIGTFKLVAFGPASEVLSDLSLSESAKSVDLEDVVREMRVSRMLGEGWIVERVAGFSVLQHEEADELLVLEDR